jgi:hypothetical protein
MLRRLCRIFRCIGGRQGFEQSGRIGRRDRRILPRASGHGKAHRQNKSGKKRGNPRLRPTRRAENLRRKSHRTTTGTSDFTAQISATIQPIMVHPKKKFSRMMAAMSRLLRARAVIDGRKYITKPKPKIGRKNAANKWVMTASFQT